MINSQRALLNYHTLYYLQEETGTFWHEHKPSESSHRGKETNQHKHPPTVELELCPHTETPACNKKTTQTLRNLDLELWFYVQQLNIVSSSLLLHV